ncbi:MAG: Sec-independent protein translocase protein TatB [Thalassobaculaceae bacterium]|nr:Sec-independent protein translocase protein TatB [Thalassobaculaceae bacterium]
MFDLGWQEFILVAIITVIVVGPKDLPRVVRSISQWVRKARSMAREFQNSLEEVAREAELDDVRREVQSISKEGIGKSIEKQIDPDGSMRDGVEQARKSANAEEIEADLKALDEETRSAASAPVTPSVDAPKAETPPIETAEDYAAKSVAPAEPKTESAPGTTAPAAPEKPRPAADSAASGQG